MKDIVERTRGGFQVSLEKLLYAYWRGLWVIVALALIVGFGTNYFTSHFVTPIYSANATIYVSNLKDTQDMDVLTQSNLTASSTLISTYAQIITSNKVLDQVVDKMGNSVTPNAIRKVMAVNQIGQTQVFQITVRYKNPQVAADIANGVADYALPVIAEIVKGSSAEIVDHATVATTPHSPNVRNFTIFGTIGGVILAIVILTLRCLLDVRIKDAETLEEIYQLPVLGRIPNFKDSESKKNTYGENVKKGRK